MRRAWTVVLTTAVVGFVLGRRIGVGAGEASMRRLNERLGVARGDYYEAEYYRAELGRRVVVAQLGAANTANQALEDRARGIGSMARLVAGQVTDTISGFDAPEARELLRSVAVLSEVADARDLAI